MRWSTIGQNLQSGDLEAVCINATHIASGQTHSFVQRKGGGVPPWSTDPQVHAIATTIGPQHTLASAAIPWIFPAVDIDGDIYCDGGLKLNTPISPALRLGADRVLVIGLRHEGEDDYDGTKIDQFPSAPFLLGKILNAFLLDKTEYDMRRLQRVNALLEAGEKAFGQDFTQALGNAMMKERGAPYRKVDTFMIRPKDNLAVVANKHARFGSVAARAPGVVGPMIRRLAETSEEGEGDLLSYLLFDGEYASDLVRMGMRDADARRQELIDFFSV